MKCVEARALLDELVDGTLADAPASGIETHVAACDECADVLDRLTEATDATALIDPVELPVGLVARLVVSVPSPSRLRADERARHRSARELRRAAGWLVAAFGLAWQLGAADVAARAVDEAAPIVADAREHVLRARVLFQQGAR